MEGDADGSEEVLEVDLGVIFQGREDWHDYACRRCKDTTCCSFEFDGGQLALFFP